jgi:hypothetical protein
MGGHQVARAHGIAAEELGGGGDFFSWYLQRDDLDCAGARGDDETIVLCLDNFSGRG